MFKIITDFADWLTYSIFGLSPDSKLGDADLGDHAIKKRAAIVRQGKSGEEVRKYIYFDLKI